MFDKRRTLFKVVLDRPVLTGPVDSKVYTAHGVDKMERTIKIGRIEAIDWQSNTKFQQSILYEVRGMVRRLMARMEADLKEYVYGRAPSTAH